MNISKSRFYTYGRIAYPKYGTMYNGRTYGPPAFLVLDKHTTRQAAQASIQADYDRGLCVAVCKGSEILKTPGLFYWYGKNQDPPSGLGILEDPIACPQVRAGHRFECLGDTGTVVSVTRRRVEIKWDTTSSIQSSLSITRASLDKGLWLGTFSLMQA